MRHRLQPLPLLTWLLLATAASFAAEPIVSRDAVAAEVRAAELAFARTMADRDFEAFGRFIAEDTVFFSGPAPLQGRAAVLESWKGFFGAGPAPFAWAPDTVVVLQSGDLALSSGPVTDPAGKVVARFTTIWRRQADGRWQVVFDRGNAVCSPATPASAPSG